jgi:AAA-like domain/TIR domain
MADVFVCYRHVNPDELLAAELATYLDAHGVSCFIDSSIGIGMLWVNEIEKQVRSCKSLVVLLSSDSIRSEMLRREVQLAHQWGKRLLPIRVGYSGALPYDLAAYLDHIQYLVWNVGDSTAAACSAVLDGIRAGLPAIAPESSPETLRRLGTATELRGAPLPVADPRLETGAVKLDSPFYVRRGQDATVERLVMQNGETILIKGPRQFGKTSLTARARAAADRNRQQSCYIDFQLLDQSRLRDSATLLKYLAARLAKEFRTDIRPVDSWDEDLGDVENLTEFMEVAILAKATAPVLVCMDEVDEIFKQPYRDNFFGMLRGWHNRRAFNAAWSRFNLLISHSSEPALFIRDLGVSPFNVGSVIRLEEFDRDEISWLNQRHGSPLVGASDLERFVRLVSGHPYLVRQGFYTMATKGLSIGDLERVSGDDSGPFGDHLRRYFWSLHENNDRLLESLRGVLKGRGCDDEGDFQLLRASGLIKGDFRTKAVPFCNLYATYLEARL